MMRDRFTEFTTAISGINKVVQHIKAEGMSLFGLKGVHTLCLYQLFLHGRPLLFSQITECCRLDPALISRTLKELCAGQMLQKDGAPGKYNARYMLTPYGQAKMRRIKPVIDEILDAADRNISEEELTVFYRVLTKLTDNLDWVANNLDSFVTKENISKERDHER